MTVVEMFQTALNIVQASQIMAQMWQARRKQRQQQPATPPQLAPVVPASANSLSVIINDPNATVRVNPDHVTIMTGFTTIVILTHVG